MKPYVLLAAVVFAGIVPFSSRAVFMDEHIYLQIARSAQTNWLFPQDTPKLFFGMREPTFVAHTHPPVGEYYLAVLYKALRGFREVPFRLLFSIFPIAAVLAFYLLAQRFTIHPLLVSLLFALSPSFFVYSPTLMMDIPMLAFLLTGFALYFGHVQGGRYFLPLASLSFVLAVGTGYTALVPLGCFFLGLLAARRPLKELACVAAAPAALALWLVAMTIHFGEFPLTRAVHYYASQGSIFRNLLATLSFVGGVVTFPWLVGARRATFAVIAVTAALLTLFWSWPTFGYRVWFIVLASSGIAILVAFGDAARTLIASGKNSGEAFLILWAPATLIFFIVVADLINARYILLALPALYLVLFRETSQRRLIATIIPAAALSIGLAIADFSFVNSYPAWVERTVPTLQQEGFRVWSASESGLRFYLERKGAIALAATDTDPGPGDLIVRHALYHYGLSDRVEPILTVLKTFPLAGSFPLRTYNPGAGAGLHDSNLGLAPFAFSSEPFDRIEVAEVSPLSGAVWSAAGPIFRQTEAEHDFPMRIPSNTKIEYEVDGDGTVQVLNGRIVLTKGPAPAIVWRNFRIVPRQFAIQ